MGRVQGGARAAFATLSWGPARVTYFFDIQNKPSARTEQGFFASFFLAMRAHERKKSGGIFHPSDFSAHSLLTTCHFLRMSNNFRPSR